MRTLRSLFALAACLLLQAGVGCATDLDEVPTWAFLGPGPPVEAPSTSNIALLQVPGSALRYTQAQLHDHNFPLDWWPSGHPAAPPIVAVGEAPSVLPCGLCHYQNGAGRPDSAALARLPTAYIVEQVEAFRQGVRGNAASHWGPVDLMHKAAASASEKDVLAAAQYYSELPFRTHVRVIEANKVPAVTAGHNVYRRVPGEALENLSARIVETPEDFARFLLRDSELRYVGYVPLGAIRRGRGLAMSGAKGRVPSCTSCHGARLTGGSGPPLAGRSPSYLFRQLYGFKSGDRRGAHSAAMVAVASQLSIPQMIDLAAYMAAARPQSPGSK